MTYYATIRRYDGNTTQAVQMDNIQIPQRVTRTGEENHFDRAYEDVQMLIAGMRALDEAVFTARGTAHHVRYDVLRLSDGVPG